MGPSQQGTLLPWSAPKRAKKGRTHHHTTSDDCGGARGAKNQIFSCATPTRNVPNSIWLAARNFSDIGTIVTSPSRLSLPVVCEQVSARRYGTASEQLYPSLHSTDILTQSNTCLHCNTSLFATWLFHRKEKRVPSPRPLGPYLNGELCNRTVRIQTTKSRKEPRPAGPTSDVPPNLPPARVDSWSCFISAT